MQFDWLTVLAQNFTRCVVEISTVLVFILDYFKEKLTWQNVSKNPKNPILGPFWALFVQIWAKMNFPGKKSLSVFRYLNYLQLCQNSVKPNEPFLRKLLDGHTKNQFIPLISLWDTANWKIQPSDWPGAFWALSQEPDFSQTWNLFKHAAITVI